MKSVFLLSLLFFPFSAFGQSIPTIHIQADKNKTFNLSEIAAQIQPVSLEMNQANHFDCISDVLWTNKYLFISVYSLELNERLPTRVLQYEPSGKYIREIGEQGINIWELMCDTIKNLLFIPKGKEVRSYDFEGKLKDTYLLKDHPGLYDKGYFWIHHAVPQQNEMHYSLVGYDVQTKKEEVFFEYVDSSLKYENVLVGRPACFTFRGQTPVVSFGLDNKLYQIMEKKLTPIVEFIIDPAPSVLEKIVPVGVQGFIGNFLCIHYFKNRQKHLYMKNMVSGKIFQTKFSSSQENTLTDGIKDDMLSTGFCDITPLNRPGYFYFIKKREELNNNPNISDKKADFTLFFVKLKP